MGRCYDAPIMTNSQSASFRLEERSEFGQGLKLWTLVFDLPGEKVNILSQKAMEDFDTILPRIETLGREGKIDVLVLLSAKPGNFIAGADLQMISSIHNAQEAEKLSRMGQRLMDRWEDLPFPTVAAVNGSALGGGCEFCLAS